MSDKAQSYLYSKDDIQNAKKAMSDYLAKITNGKLLAGCCTQDCCDLDAQKSLFDAWFNPEGKIKLYTKEHIIEAKAAMLAKLAELNGGVLLAGCCTQGCCDQTAMTEMRILIPNV